MPSTSPYNNDGRSVNTEIDGNLAIKASAGGDGNLSVAGSATLAGGTVTPGGLLSNSYGVNEASDLLAPISLASFSAATLISPTLTLPAGEPVAGALYVERMAGLFSSASTTTTYQFIGMYGATVIVTMPAIAIASALTAQAWELEYWLYFQTPILAFGYLKATMTVTAATGITSVYSQHTPAAGVAVVVTSQKAMTVTVTPSSSNASIAITANEGFGERIA